ncbi:6-bladed beta-propeller [Algoriphagus namhaensis]
MNSVENFRGSFKIESLLHLETTNTSLLGNYLQIVWGADRIFVMDESSKVGVFVFDENGDFINLIGLVGEAPGTIPNLIDYTLSEGLLMTMSSLGDRVLLSKFNFSNELLESVEIPLNVESFAFSKNGSLYLYTGMNPYGGEFRLYQLDSKYQISKAFIPNLLPKDFLAVGSRSFFPQDNEILFKEVFSPNIYILSDEGPKLIESFDFGSFSVPEEFWSMIGVSGFELINSTGFADITHIDENESFLIFEVTFQKENVVSKEIFLKNKGNSTLSKIDLSESIGIEFISTLGIYQNGIKFLAEPRALIQNSDRLNLSAGAKETLLTLDVDDNPIIVYVELL